MPTVLLTTVGAGTWTVPARITSLDVQLVGAGGGGGNGYNSGGGGGGGTTFGSKRAGGGGGGATGGSFAGANSSQRAGNTSGAGGSGGGGRGGKFRTRGVDGTGSGGGGGSGADGGLRGGGDGGPDGGGHGGEGAQAPGEGTSRTAGRGGLGDTANGGNGENSPAGVHSSNLTGGASGAASVTALSGYGQGSDGIRAAVTRVSGAGGGGGGYTQAIISVTPGSSISYYVGGGGERAGQDGASQVFGQNGAIRITYSDPTVVSANAGTNKTVASGGSVQIGGTDSITNGSGATTYRWVRRSGTGGSLSSTTVARPTFNAPTLSFGDPTRTIVFRKTTTNNGVSDFDDVSIAVTAPSVAPSKIYVGGERITKLYIGDEEIPTIYVGDDKVFG